MAIPVFGEAPTGTGNEDLDVNSIAVGAGTAGSPGVAIGQVDDGFFSTGDSFMQIALNGIGYYYINTLYLGSTAAFGAILNRATATATAPGASFFNDFDTGVGRAAADQLSLIAGGVEALRLTENGGVLQTHQTTAGITAHVGSSQGDGPLTSSINEISVCANANDAVTLPAAVVNQSYIVTIINNGAQVCDVFPASGDDCGGGADTAVALAAGANITYRNYNATTWVAIT